VLEDVLEFVHRIAAMTRKRKIRACSGQEFVLKIISWFVHTLDMNQ